MTFLVFMLRFCAVLVSKSNQDLYTRLGRKEGNFPCAGSLSVVALGWLGARIFTMVPMVIICPSQLLTTNLWDPSTILVPAQSAFPYWSYYSLLTIMKWRGNEVAKEIEKKEKEIKIKDLVFTILESSLKPSARRESKGRRTSISLDPLRSRNRMIQPIPNRTPVLPPTKPPDKTQHPHAEPPYDPPDDNHSSKDRAENYAFSHLQSRCPPKHHHLAPYPRLSFSLPAPCLPFAITTQPPPNSAPRLPIIQVSVSLSGP